MVAIFGVLIGLVNLDLMAAYLSDRHAQREWQREEEFRLERDAAMTRLFPPRQEFVFGQVPPKGVTNERVWREVNDFHCLARNPSTEEVGDNESSSRVIELGACTRQPF